MAKLKGLTMKKNKVEQEIDLKQVFGTSFKGRRDLREAIGQAMVDKMLKRTAKGLERGGKKDLKKPYSDRYEASLEFKAAGKKKNSINMSLTGDMMGLLDVKKQTGDTITIGWDDKTQNNKAFNHNTGDGKNVPRRTFFGLNNNELQEIKKEFKSEINEAIKGPVSEDSNFLLSIIDKIKSDV